jgi:nucleoside phosphorylase
MDASSSRCVAVIITALPIERQAVVEHLREVVEDPPVAGSIYRRGTFDGVSESWDVIVAEIGAGNVVAAAETERVVSRYSPHVAMFVGVAGGVKDVAHGDIVVSTKIYGYESGKDERSLKLRPSVQLAAYGLEARARHEAGEPGWLGRIKRDAQSQGPVVPTAKVGPIAAGEKVVASSRSRTFKFIRKHYSDAVAVEMEGHGFLLGVRMNHPTEGIVVRGISDLIEGKDEGNDATWQPIAARHAAAFAFQVLAKYLPSGKAISAPPANPIDLRWQEQHLRDARATAGPRYSSVLQVGTQLHDVFEALGHTNEWLSSVRSQHKELSRLLKRFVDCIETTSDSGWGTAFPEHLRDAGHALAEEGQGVVQALAAIGDGAPSDVHAALPTSAVMVKARELLAALRIDLEKKHGAGVADSASFRQFQAEYQATFPAANFDTTQELVACLEEIETWQHSGPARASSAKGVLLVGEAGVGKTHGICDIADDRLRRGLHTVVLFGEHFTSACEPWERIRQLIGLGPLTRDEILTALDTAGASSGHPLLMCIDGLNESRPRVYWRGWLGSLAAQVSRYPNIRLCVSCRTTYESLVVPDEHGLERVEHLGFAGVEFDACRQFFSHHGLEPPVAPSFHPEFSNPLFLKLACKTLQASGEQRMPTAWRGLNTALNAFVSEQNKEFAREHERDARERVPQRALDEFIAEVERVGKVYLPWSQAAAALNRIQPVGIVGPTVLEWLVRAGLLITDADPDNSAPDAEEIVRVAFERFGDHLLATRLLSRIKPGELGNAVQSGPLAFALANPDAIEANRGLVEALTIQTPEHPEHATELADGLPPGSARDAVLRATISALPWRDPDLMTSRVQELGYEALATKGFAYEAFDNLLSVATQVTPPDALWLHRHLERQPLQARDGFLCGYLHERLEGATAVSRLLRAPFEIDSNQIPEPMCIRWAILLLWFCSAADRRVRDRATKGLIAITQGRPQVWVTLIEEFASVDDDYVVERCLCAAYGVLLRSRSPNVEREVASVVYRAVFLHPKPTQNALIRDHARCILELAHFDGVLPANVELKRALPPYQSDWPLDIPSEDSLKQYDDARKEYPKLYMSCLQDDFFTYTLSGLEPYMHVISRAEMGRWILHHVISDIGYGGKALASYDGYMLYNHGPGRGRPGWAERIGKKYQWIALNRLAARLADHVKPKRDRWDPKVRGVPLVYARGRDLDPSLLAKRDDSPRKGTDWWLPTEYDFGAVANQSTAEWTSTCTDVPASDKMLQPLPRTDGGEWQLLEGYPTWIEAHDTDDNRPYREVWTQIRGYLVKKKSARRAFNWLAKRHFMGRWMIEGAELHEGYVGEYPWGILFTMHPEEWYSRGGRQKPPVRLAPICNALSSSYEEDAYQEGGITVHVPAQTFFEPKVRLRWDGLGGYRDANGRSCFLDPSAAETGAAALLVDRSFLLDFLRERQLAVVWSVLGEKLLIRAQPTGAPRIEFSRAHMLDEFGQLYSSDLLLSVDIAEGSTG